MTVRAIKSSRVSDFKPGDYVVWHRPDDPTTHGAKGRVIINHIVWEDGEETFLDDEGAMQYVRPAV
jgi:hypothetical protein